MVQRILHVIEKYDVRSKWLEIDSIAGTFALPISQEVQGVIAAEPSKISRLGLERSIKKAGIKNISVTSTNFHRPNQQSVEIMESVDALLVHPHHTGLGQILSTLQSISSLPSLIIYISHHPNTLMKDGVSLQKLGYTLVEFEGVDLFPNTQNCEWIGAWMLQ